MAAGEVVAVGIDVAAMVTAALGQTSGTQKAHYCNAVLTALGASPKIILKREGSTVYQSTYSSSLTVSSGSLVLPASIAAPSINTAADIDTGTWLLEVEKASDSGVKLQLSLGPAGGSTLAFLSQDLDGSNVVVPSVISLSAPASLDVGYVPPGSGTIGSLTVQTLIDDMGLFNDHPAYGFNSGWSRNPGNAFVSWGNNWQASVQEDWFKNASGNVAYVNAYPYWRYFLPWMVPYIADSHPSTALNVGLRMSRFRMFARIRSNQQYVLLRKDNNGAGTSWFQAALGNALGTDGDVEERKLSDYVEVWIKNIFSSSEAGAGIGYAHHGLWSSPQFMDESPYDYIVCAAKAQLVKWNAAGADNLDAARIVMAMGGDPYPGGGWTPASDRPIPSYAHSRLKLITRNAQWFTTSNLLNARQTHNGPTASISVQSLRDNPPPAFLLEDAPI